MSTIDIATKINILVGGPLSVYTDGISGEMLLALRLLAYSQGERMYVRYNLIFVFLFFNFVFLFFVFYFCFTSCNERLLSATVVRLFESN